MGELIKTFRVRLSKRRKPMRMKLFFDTGSPWTFITESAARRLVKREPYLYELPEPKSFGGLGNGRFTSHQMVNVEVHLDFIWGMYAMYVVPDAAMEPGWDVLIGHDFIQKYGVTCLLPQRRVKLDRSTLRHAYIVV